MDAAAREGCFMLNVLSGDAYDLFVGGVVHLPTALALSHRLKFGRWPWEAIDFEAPIVASLLAELDALGLLDDAGQPLLERVSAAAALARSFDGAAA